MLKGRHKDGIKKERQVFRVTHSVEQFDEALDELRAMARDGERIYAAAGERSVARAIREFKRRQLDADYDDDPERFYRGLWDRWVSCLMSPVAQANKLWLFDCDSAEDVDLVMGELREHYNREMQPYCYPSKSGQHIVVQPFDRTWLRPQALALMHANPIILWGY